MKINTLFLVVIFTLTLQNLSAQFKNPAYKQKFNGSELVNLSEEVQFKPVNKLKGMTKAMKALLLSLTDDSYEIQQGNDDAWYLCFKKNDEFFRIWNMYYTKLTQGYWDKNCIGLVFLILLDNPSLAPKN